MKKVLFASLFIGLSLSAQTTVTCDTSKPIGYNFPAIASAVPSSDGKTVTVVSAQPATSIDCVIASVSTPPPTPPPTINPLVQKADCTTNWGKRCSLHLAALPAIGHHIIIFVSSLYGNAGLSTPLNTDVNLYTQGSSYPPDQLIASKYVATASDQTQDYLVTAATSSYFKAIVVEVQNLSPSSWFDAGSPLFDQRSVTSYNANLNANYPDYIFSMTHSAKYDIGDASTDGWGVIDKITDGVFGDVLLLQYKPVLAGEVTITGTSSTTQNLESVMAAYKQVQ